MRIDDVSVRSTGSAACVIELSTGTGLAGLAPCPPFAARRAERLARERLVGESAHAAPALWEHLRRVTGGAAHDAAAVAALDLALWDLKARLNGEPLWRTLGGSRRRANVYVSIPASWPTETLTTRLSHLADAYGLSEAKLASVDEPDLDIERLLAARTALTHPTKEQALMLDAGAGWQAKQAAQRIQAIEREVDLKWVEDPRPAWDFLGLRRVTGSIAGGVCSGGELGPDQFLALLHHRAADVIEIDLARTGITGALLVADAASALELPVTLAALPGNVHAHLAAVLRNLVSVELDEPHRLAPTVTSDVRLEGGWLNTSDSPGLGLAVSGSP